MKTEFISAFQITEMKIFEVRYYTLGSNSHPYFSTTAGEFIIGERDWDTAGQAQEEVLNKYSRAYKFYKKWDECHLKDLTDEQYAEMVADLEELKSKYNYIYKELDTTQESHSTDIPFHEIVELSKQPLKFYVSQQ